MGNYRLLIFDLDGTLIDSQNDIASAVNHVRARYCEPPIGTDTVRSYVGNGVTALLQKALPEISGREMPEAREYFRDYYLNHLLDTTNLYPGIREMLENLADPQKAILTNKPQEYSVKIIGQLSVAGHFALVWGGDTGTKRKPDAEPVLKIMERLRAVPEETLMIGDGVNDILAARAAGVHCLAVGYGYTPRQELLDLKPDHFVESPIEILDVVDVNRS